MPSENQTLKLAPGESLRIVSSDPGALVVEATYDVAGRPPPKHMHPQQDELFEVLEGKLTVRIAGEQETLPAGETIAVPRRVTHQMWNAGETPAKVRWTTSPAGRTEEWFRALDALRKEGKVDKNGMPAVLPFARLAADYDDTFRLVVGPDLASRLVIRAMAFVGRLRGA
ncbi:hypothetical protein BH10ACT11_BH10ACT11_21810 [soil metagenome]